jgi:phosphatidylglycerol:prolipoprotein diacylglycerol transferase
VPLALIPYFHIPIYEPIPGLVIDSWAVLVALAFIVGMEIARARGIRLGLEVRDIVDGIVVTVGMGFFVGHIVHVLAYNPDTFREEGVISLLKFWAGFSSMGGLIGAVIGSVLFYTVIRKRPYWIHADTITYAFPFGFCLGRLGCFTAHDHIGKQSNFFLAVDFKAPLGPRHDLGLDEALWVMAIAAIFFALRNRPFRPGFHLGLFALLYAPVRIGLDFLRNTDLADADIRYAGLTFAQWGSIAMAFAGIAVLVWIRRYPLVDPRGSMEAPASPTA